MARIVGVTIPDNVRVEYGLTRIYGLGFSKARNILKEVNIDLQKRISDLSEKERSNLQSFIEKNHVIEGDLREEVRQNIKRVREIGTYKGIRQGQGLPARGQRTRSNARTNRGKRRTVGAFKKEDLIKMQQSSVKKK